MCKSLVNRNQLLECCQSEAGTEHPIFVNEKGLGPVSEVAKMEFLVIEDAIHHAVRVKWLILHGNKYICDRSQI